MRIFNSWAHFSIFKEFPQCVHLTPSVATCDMGNQARIFPRRECHRRELKIHSLFGLTSITCDSRLNSSTEANTRKSVLSAALNLVDRVVADAGNFDHAIIPEAFCYATFIDGRKQFDDDQSFGK